MPSPAPEQRQNQPTAERMAHRPLLRPAGPQPTACPPWPTARRRPPPQPRPAGRRRPQGRGCHGRCWVPPPPASLASHIEQPHGQRRQRRPGRQRRPQRQHGRPQRPQQQRRRMRLQILGAPAASAARQGRGEAAAAAAAAARRERARPRRDGRFLPRAATPAAPSSDEKPTLVHHHITTFLSSITRRVTPHRATRIGATGDQNSRRASSASRPRPASAQADRSRARARAYS